MLSAMRVIWRSNEKTSAHARCGLPIAGMVISGTLLDTSSDVLRTSYPKRSHRTKPKVDHLSLLQRIACEDGGTATSATRKPASLRDCHGHPVHYSLLAKWTS